MNQDSKWWQSAVIYQIYPSSFLDSDGDGLGDLQGIIKKLPYLKDLGVDAIWINPFFKSPMVDCGYDISDYCQVNLQFGSNQDMVELIQKAHKIGLKVIFDMVFNHTSDQHPWFLESKSSKNNPKRNWYIWKPEKINNWVSIFGGSAWEKSNPTEEFYYHSFLPQEPDLNLRNPKVQAEILKILEFYLKLGVDGFRLDSVNTFFKDIKYRDNPEIKPFEQIYKSFVYNFDHNLNYKFIAKIKAKINQFQDRVLIGEVNNFGPKKRAWLKYYGKNGSGLDLIFNFKLLYENLDFRLIYEFISSGLKLPKESWNSLTLGSHDQIRFPSRLGVDVNHKDDKIKLLSAFLLTCKGTPFIYYGEELGLDEFTDFTKDQIRDTSSIRNDYKTITRDGCRTPMLWNKTPQAGFSKTPETWLPIHKNYVDICLESQIQNPNSIFNHYKKLLKIRKEYLPLELGEIKLNRSSNSVIKYSRKYGSKIIKVVLNFSSNSIKIPKNITIIDQNNFVSGNLKPLGYLIYLKNN
jgi:alpha-glucosidase